MIFCGKKNEKLLLIFVEIVWESKPQLVKFCLLSQPVLGGCWVFELVINPGFDNLPRWPSYHSSGLPILKCETCLSFKII
jgi:hypothetical protein